MNHYFIVNGYGWSGSSAAVDLLREFDGCCEMGAELRVVQDPHGLGDLYESLVSNWDILNSDMAVREFLWFTECLNRKTQMFRLKSGGNYGEYFKGNFMRATNDFIREIVDFRYAATWSYLNLLKTPLEMFVFRLLKKTGRLPRNEKMYFTKVSKEEFIDAARDYIDGIYGALAAGCDTVIVDAGTRILHYDIEMSFYRDSRMILVDRDPRDICADLIKSRALIGVELKKSRDMRKYVKYHRAMRENNEKLRKDPNVLQIRFEDLVLNYDDSVSRICEFCDLDTARQREKMKFFDPALSKKNIGLYREYLTKKETKYIEKELKEYLY